MRWLVLAEDCLGNWRPAGRGGEASQASTPPVTATNVLGRLTKATAPTSLVTSSYDPYGRINAEVFTDRTTGSSNIYVEKHDYHGDGSASALHLLLPDTNNFADERVDYTYDSAGRARSAAYTLGTSTQNLFSAPGTTDIDVLGRVRQATYASATFDATFAVGALTAGVLLRKRWLVALAPVAEVHELAGVIAKPRLPGVAAVVDRDDRVRPVAGLRHRCRRGRPGGRGATTHPDSQRSSTKPSARSAHQRLMLSYS